MNSRSPYSLVFGPFSLDFPQRTLWRDAAPVRLGSRAIGILVALTEVPGELLSRETLLARVWTDVVVDEGALRVHVSALRKALGDGVDGLQYVSNEPGRGYRFVAAVNRLPSSPVVQTMGPAAACSLPGQVTRVLGRDAIVAQLLARLSGQRCLTISGLGGIGKTTVALALAHAFVEAGHGRACFVDFAQLIDPSHITRALALALGVPECADDPLPAIVAALGGEAMLLLDNCEHLVDALTPVVEHLLQAVPTLRLIVTSREPLRTGGEWVHRLAPLETPAPCLAPDVAQAHQFAAVRLFVERATEVSETFVLSEQNVIAVCDICRRLDGIPLAIELAAARADWLDAATIAARLDLRFGLLTKGRRTALPRQQTLRATLDWSYDLLSPQAQAVLRRVAPFRASFEMAAILAVSIGGALDAPAVLDAAAELVAKSLLNCDTTKEHVQFRLLDTTRDYGIDRLRQCGETQLASRSHALYCSSLLAAARDGWSGSALRQDLGVRRRQLDDLRAALEWAFGADGDPACGIEIIAASSSLWFEMSLPQEFLAQGERALAASAKAPVAAALATASTAELLTARGHAQWHTLGPGPAMEASFNHALGVAEAIGDATLELRALLGLWIHRILNGRYAESMELAVRYQEIALSVGVPGAIASANTMLLQSRFYTGDPCGARAALEQLAGFNDLAPPRREINAAQIDRRLAAQAQLGVCMCLQGDIGAALTLARAMAAEAAELGHDLSLCWALGKGAIPVAIMAGKLDWAATLSATLRMHAQRGNMQYWDRWGAGYQAVLQGNSLDLRQFTMMQIETLGVLGLGDAIAHLESSNRYLNAGWAQPELLRLHAERTSDPLGGTALATLERAHRLALRQGTVCWQLRCALSLAKARRASGTGATALLALAATVRAYRGCRRQSDFLAARRFLHAAPLQGIQFLPGAPTVIP